MKGLKHMADLMAAAPDNATAKRRWLNAARLACKSVAKDLGLAPGTFEGLCLGTSMSGGELVGFARSCKGRKDYTGGVNRGLSTRMTFDKMVQVCREAMGVRKYDREEVVHSTIRCATTRSIT